MSQNLKDRVSSLNLTLESKVLIIFTVLLLLESIFGFDTYMSYVTKY